ncbi:Glycine cleavage system H protein [Aphelenchoides besseyi]|nr:Glycine cleavage system H protein [Aphelenchoides besseyi]KAI6202450.1 Glycine cleavage system H protein [Aphelenchoides besseyi]
MATQQCARLYCRIIQRTFCLTPRACGGESSIAFAFVNIFASPFQNSAVAPDRVVLPVKNRSRRPSSNRCVSDRYYTKRHEWIRFDEEKKIGTVGISEFAQEALGDVVYVELPELGTQLERGDTAGAIESVKAASDVYAPISGKVTDRNSKIEETPTLINKSPYDKGWLFKLEVKDEAQIKDLMNEASYEVFRSQEVGEGK